MTTTHDPDTRTANALEFFDIAVDAMTLCREIRSYNATVRRV